MDASKSTVCLYAAGTITLGIGKLSRKLRDKGLQRTFDLAYTVAANEVLELRFESLWTVVEDFNVFEKQNSGNYLRSANKLFGCQLIRNLRES